MDKTLIILLALLCAYFIFANTSTHNLRGMPNDYKIYGKMSCGWTKKQIEYMQENQLPFEFIDCKKGMCDSTVTSYPTTRAPNGEMVIGYTEF